MRITINGKRYRLKESVSLRLQGIGLVLLGIACHKVNADEVAIFLWLYGAIMLISNKEEN